jgi:hypothetical protein
MDQTLRLSEAKEMVDQTGIASWNRIADWLR